MTSFIKKISCRHKWELLEKPYLYECGKSKRANYKCVKCNKFKNMDIFEAGRLKYEKDECRVDDYRSSFGDDTKS